MCVCMCTNVYVCAYVCMCVRVCGVGVVPGHIFTKPALGLEVEKKLTTCKCAHMLTFLSLAVAQPSPARQLCPNKPRNDSANKRNNQTSGS